MVLTGCSCHRRAAGIGPSPLSANQAAVISTEAADSLIVCCAVEKPASLPQLPPSSQSPFCSPGAPSSPRSLRQRLGYSRSEPLSSTTAAIPNSQNGNLPENKPNGVGVFFGSRTTLLIQSSKPHANHTKYHKLTSKKPSQTAVFSRTPIKKTPAKRQNPGPCRVISRAFAVTYFAFFIRFTTPASECSFIAATASPRTFFISAPTALSSMLSQSPDVAS